MKDELLALAERVWRKHDAHQTAVIRGEDHAFYGDDARFNVFDVKPDPGEPPYLTLGIFLGNHQWAMKVFTPEQALACAGLILSRKSVQDFAAAALRSKAKDYSGENNG